MRINKPLVSALITVIILFVTGCGDYAQPEFWTDLARKGFERHTQPDYSLLAPIWFQGFCFPTGVPLSDKQQERIVVLTRNRSQSSMLRAEFGVLTDVQKLVFAEDMRQKIAESGCPPLTEKQFERLRSFGPDSGITSFYEILTRDQLTALSPQKTVPQPPPDHVRALRRIESDLAGHTVDGITVLQHIYRFQEVLAPAGDSLTVTQKNSLLSAWHPDGHDLRPVYTIMTESQKRAIIRDVGKYLASGGHPLDTRQTEQIMALGKTSDDRCIWDILTPAQAVTWSRVQVERKNKRHDLPYQKALWMSYVEHSGWTELVAER